MSEALLLLRLEHANFAKLLGLLEEQLANLKAITPHGFDLLRGNVAYFKEYPDTCHHPIEDAILRKLQQRNPSTAEQIGGLYEHHEHLAQLTQRLADAVQETEIRPQGPHDRLARVIREFIDGYRHHLELEEKSFFPAALNALSDNDWEEIEFALFDRDDPLFSPKIEDQFQDLKDRIEQLGKQQHYVILLKEELNWLRSLTTLVSFNAAIQKNDQYLSLQQNTEGGYVLRRDNKPLVDIPKCSEREAIWCACYFLKGQEAAAVSSS